MRHLPDMHALGGALKALVEEEGPEE
jgi:hypothetical protein